MVCDPGTLFEMPAGRGLQKRPVSLSAPGAGMERCLMAVRSRKMPEQQSADRRAVCLSAGHRVESGPQKMREQAALYGRTDLAKW
jgi:hypothetical protein